MDRTDKPGGEIVQYRGLPQALIDEWNAEAATREDMERTLREACKNAVRSVGKNPRPTAEQVRIATRRWRR